jgi:hypothetical protein
MQIYRHSIYRCSLKKNAWQCVTKQSVFFYNTVLEFVSGRLSASISDNNCRAIVVFGLEATYPFNNLRMAL